MNHLSDRSSTGSNIAVINWNGEVQDGVLHQYILGNGYRAYNPVLQRFTAPDSLSPFGAGGVNPYAYCAGDPINHTDPTGHFIVALLASLILPVVAGAAVDAAVGAVVEGGAIAAGVAAGAADAGGEAGVAGAEAVETAANSALGRNATGSSRRILEDSAINREQEGPSRLKPESSFNDENNSQRQERTVERRQLVSHQERQLFEKNGRTPLKYPRVRKLGTIKGRNIEGSLEKNQLLPSQMNEFFKHFNRVYQMLEDDICLIPDRDFFNFVMGDKKLYGSWTENNKIAAFAKQISKTYNMDVMDGNYSMRHIMHAKDPIYYPPGAEIQYPLVFKERGFN